MGKEGVKIEIMDTTLRDGEQTSGVSFVPHEKLMIARLLLEDLKVDRVEVASARVSDGEFEAVKMICDWAARRNLLHKVEVLGFVDGHTSVDWIQRTGCRVINLLCKGSLKHCTQQLKKTPEEHLQVITVVKQRFLYRLSYCFASCKVNDCLNSFIFCKYCIQTGKVQTVQLFKNWANTGNFLYIVNNVGT